MHNWRQITNEAKDILTVCLAKAIDKALVAQIGDDWFAKFAEEEAPKKESVRIPQPGHTSTKNLDMQALLKILYFREKMAEEVYAYYGIFADLDEFTAQGQKRQLSQLLNRLIKDFRNSIEAHARSGDVEKRLAGEKIDVIYGDEQAFDDMCVLIKLFDKVTDKRGVSYATRLITLPQRKKRKKIFLAVGAAIMALAVGCSAWLLSGDPDNVYKSQRTPVVKQGEITIQPIYVHYEKKTLVAECYVINGTDQTISNIDVYKFCMTEGGQDLAAANFGVLEGVTLAPGESIKWTFTFPKKTVFSYDAYLPDVQIQFACRHS